MSEIWSNLILYLNHLTELNKTREEIDSYMSKCFHENLNALVENVKKRSFKNVHPTAPNFAELFAMHSKRKCHTNLHNISHYIKNYCALTIALTGGLLVPSTIEKKLCENLNIKFGFRNIEYAKYVERHFSEFLITFTNSIFLSTDLILLFGLEETVMKLNVQDVLSTDVESKTRDFAGQTEIIIENNLLPSNWINVTWNIWDYHRETIRLAELRKRQTNSTQTVVSYGTRTAQNQTHNIREHLTSMSNATPTCEKL